MKLNRALALKLLYFGGGLSLATAAAQVWLSPLPTLATVAFNATEAIGLLACIPGIVLLARRPFQREPRVDDQPGWDSLHAAQLRLQAYAQEAASYSFAVLYLLITTGILVLLVVTRVLTDSTADDYQRIVFGLAFVAMAAGGFLPFIALQREADNLRKLAHNAETK